MAITNKSDEWGRQLRERLMGELDDLITEMINREDEIGVLDVTVINSFTIDPERELFRRRTYQSEVIEHLEMGFISEESWILTEEWICQDIEHEQPESVLITRSRQML